MLSILDLDDDCLRSVFQYLTIYELLEAEKVCETFKVTCESVYASKRFHKMRIELRYLLSDHLKDIFDRVGKTLRRFEFSGGYIMDTNVMKVVIDGVTESCPRLKSLSINYIQLKNDSFTRLNQCFCNLTTLDLSRCGIDESTLGATLDGEHCKSIKTLALAGNACMTGSFFKELKHVENLDVSYCFQLNNFQFVNFLRNCLKLVSLDLTASCQVITEDENFLETICLYQPKIEKLLMDNTGVTVDSGTMLKFKKLKHSSFSGRKFGT